MIPDRLRSARLVALFLLGALGFNAPPLAGVSLPGTVLGLPLPYVYLFTVWALLILAIALAVRPKRGE